jgi:hypothetical protein
VDKIRGLAARTLSQRELDVFVFRAAPGFRQQASATIGSSCSAFDACSAVDFPSASGKRTA